MICPKCGSEEDGKFCSVCGTQLTPAAAEPVQTVPETEPAAEAEPVQTASEPVQIPEAAPVQAAPAAAAKQGGKNKTLLIAAAVAGVILILAALIFGGSALSRKNKYEKAWDLLEEGDIAQAKELWTELGDYKDSAEQAAALTSRLPGVSDEAYFRAVALLNSYDEEYWQECYELWEKKRDETFASPEEAKEAKWVQIYDVMGETAFVRSQIPLLEAITEKTSGPEYTLEVNVKTIWLLGCDAMKGRLDKGEDTSTVFQLIVLMAKSDLLDDKTEKDVADIMSNTVLEMDRTLDITEDFVELIPTYRWFGKTE